MYQVEIYDEADFILQYPQIYNIFRPKIPVHFEFRQCLSLDTDSFSVVYVDPNDEDLSAHGELSLSNKHPTWFEIDRD